MAIVYLSGVLQVSGLHIKNENEYRKFIKRLKAAVNEVGPHDHDYGAADFEIEEYAGYLEDDTDIIFKSIIDKPLGGLYTAEASGGALTIFLFGDEVLKLNEGEVKEISLIYNQLLHDSGVNIASAFLRGVVRGAAHVMATVPLALDVKFIDDEEEDV